MQLHFVISKYCYGGLICYFITFLIYLFITGNILGDSGLEQLTKVWGTLPNLQLLDLSNNNITAIGLQNLSRVAENSSEDSAAEKPLQVSGGSLSKN